MRTFAAWFLCTLYMVIPFNSQLVMWRCCLPHEPLYRFAGESKQFYAKASNSSATFALTLTPPPNQAFAILASGVRAVSQSNN